jgi:uncharacterized membrane protein YeaQ/YmgE (transglycosylase-associated protein family)
MSILAWIVLGLIAGFIGSKSRITNRIRSSITELSFHGISSPAPSGRKV